MTTILTRADAVDAIARHLADRTAFIVFASPALRTEMTDRLARIPGWTGYFDTGRDLVAQAGPGTFAALGRAARAVGLPVAAVLTIPKTVPAAALSAVLGQPIADDGSQDVIGLHEYGPVVWPLLFVDALALVDPAAAAQLRANSLGQMS